MTCAEKLDYSEEKVQLIIVRKRRANSTSLSLFELTVPRGKTQVKMSGVRSGCSG